MNLLSSIIHLVLRSTDPSHAYETYGLRPLNPHSNNTETGPLPRFVLVESVAALIKSVPLGVQLHPPNVIHLGEYLQGCHCGLGFIAV